MYIQESVAYLQRLNPVNRLNPVPNFLLETAAQLRTKSGSKTNRLPIQQSRANQKRTNSESKANQKRTKSRKLRANACKSVTGQFTKTKTPEPTEPTAENQQFMPLPDLPISIATTRDGATMFARKSPRRNFSARVERSNLYGPGK